MEEHLLMHK